MNSNLSKFDTGYKSGVETIKRHGLATTRHFYFINYKIEDLEFWSGVSQAIKDEEVKQYEAD